MAENRINFTKAAIYGLPTPSKGTVTYRDSKEKGLSLYITKNRVITFFVRKRIRGVDKRFIIGNFPEITVETARKATVNIRGEVGRGNVLSMRWDELNINEGSRKWRIPETKNGEALTIPLNEEAVEMLNARKLHQESEGIKSKWVFPSLTSKSGHLEEPKKGWTRILKRANIKGLRIHDLRRTLGSWQAMTGTTTAIIGKTLGHKSKTATAIYERMNLDPVREGINKACDAMTKNSKEIIKQIIQYPKVKK